MTTRTSLPTLTVPTAILVLGGALCGSAGAQDSAKPDAANAATQPGSITAIDDLYRKELSEVERRRLARLAALASTQPKDEANQTYESYFRAAIAANLFTE